MSAPPPIFFFPNSYFADEYAVRGRRWIDCIGRMVMRPSEREIASQCLVLTGDDLVRPSKSVVLTSDLHGSSSDVDLRRERLMDRAALGHFH